MMLIYILLCVICVILIALVLMQDSKSGLGGLTGGTTMSAFGANTDKALIKATGIVGALFFILVVVIHLVKKDDTQGGSLMEASTKTTKITAPTVNLAPDKKEPIKVVAPKKDEATTTPAKEGAEETKGTSVTIPLKDVKEATPAKTESKDKPVAPAEPEK